jgi:diaminopimelate epimerase
MIPLTFYKMEGTGNDFIVIDNREQKFSLEDIILFTPKLCDRRFGIGADGLLVLENPQIENVDYTMIYRNADGSDAGMCGNGSRCLALFAAKNGYGAKQSFNVHNSFYKAEVNLERSMVTVDFPDVNTPENIFINQLQLIKVYTGTEHVVTFVDRNDLDDEKELVKIGSRIRFNEMFNPPGTNVNFVHSEDNQSLMLQTYERGVEGLTLACGTGAIASAIADHFHSEDRNSKVRYSLKVKGGVIYVSFSYNQTAKIYQNIKLIGPANFVFKGSIDV